VLRVEQHAAAKVRHGQRDVLEGRHERELRGARGQPADDQLALRLCTPREHAQAGPQGSETRLGEHWQWKCGGELYFSVARRHGQLHK
jgi:hypothetical protein